MQPGAGTPWGPVESGNRYDQSQLTQVPWGRGMTADEYPTHVMPIWDAVRSAFAKTFDYSGRASRSEYWWFVLVSSLAFLPLYPLAVVPFFFGGETGIAVGIGFNLLLVLLGLALMPVVLSLTVRRLHDTDRSGWWLLVSFVPFGSFVLLIFYVEQGTFGPNRFGPPPTNRLH